jgi:hypothetical protein
MSYFDDYGANIFEDDSLALTKRGKPRKRKPKEPRVYFTQDTEDAIIEYLSCEDDIERNLIYNGRIEYAFYKLVENIIHTFKFYYTDTDTIEELKHEVITFLLEKLHLFNHSKNINDKLTKIIVGEFLESYTPNSFLEYVGSSITVTQQQINDFIETLNVSSECLKRISQLSPPKAFSYFGTIAKRYLIVYNENNYKKLQEKANVDESDDEQIMLYENDKNVEMAFDEMSFMDQYTQYIDTHLFKLFPKKQDAQTADAIVELFRKRETLEIFNKKALYIYIREITDVSTPQITKIIKKLKIIYAQLYNEYYNYGRIRI